MIEALDQITGGHGRLAVLAIAVLLTVIGAALIRRAHARLTRGPWGARIANYMRMIASGWLLTALALVAVWYIAAAGGYTFAAALDYMGLNLRPEPSTALLWVVTMVLIASALTYAIARLRNWTGGAPTAAGLDVLPQTPAETAVFSLLVAPTAGIGEEIVYRGFLMGQFWIVTNNAWLAAAISSALFGLAHAYQGRWGILRTALIGFAFAIGVIETGSLVPSILAHTLANMVGATRRPRVPAPAQAPAA